jgi:formate-dependent nitrite reductase membrane component NrfD
MPSDTFYTLPPEWHWLVILYFFFGGIAGGSYFLAALMDLFGQEHDRPLARLAYAVAFFAVLLCPLFLILDLNRPERFWHMLVQDHTLRPSFKYWSPISVGSWGLLAFSGFAFLSYLGVLAEDGRLRWSPLLAVRRGVLRTILALLGGFFGFFLAGYTGVLLNVTNRPIWGDTPLLGLLFLASGASTAAALLLLLGRRKTEAPPAESSLHRLERMERLTSTLELLVLAALVITLGPVVRVWLSGWGLLLLVGVVLAGILVPLALQWRPRLLGAATATTGAALVLLGGFLLRAVVILSAQAV